MECMGKFDLSYDSDGDLEMCPYRPPPSLIFENEDGRSITLRQFVTKVHAYLSEHMEQVKQAQCVWPPSRGQRMNCCAGAPGHEKPIVVASL